MPVTQETVAIGTGVSGGTSAQLVQGTVTQETVGLSAVVSQGDNINVVVLVLDDIGLEKLHQYDAQTGNTNTTCRIPNIKQHVIDRGVTFRRFWANPSCGPTRASIESGLYQHHHGLYLNILDNPSSSGGNFYVGQNPLDKNNRTPQLIQLIPHEIRGGRPKNLYRQAKIGKSHMQQSDYYAWMCGNEGWEIFKGHMKNVSDHLNWEYVDAARDLNTGSSSYTIDPPGGTNHAPFGLDQEIADIEAVLEDFGTRPFILWWCPSVGHAPYQTPDPNRVSDASKLDWTTAFGGSYPTIGTDFSASGSSDPTDVAKRIMTQKHQIECVDAVFGEAVALLQANGQYDKTVFIVFCDNGTELTVVEPPFDGTKAKRTPYAPAVWLPLFIGGALVKQTPRNSNEMVNIVDLEATIRDITECYPQALAADIASGGRPRDGVSILKHLQDPSKGTGRLFNFSMVSSADAGVGWNPTTKIFSPPVNQTAWAITDNVYTYVKFGGSVPIEKLFLASDFNQADSSNLLVTSPTDPAVQAGLVKLRALLAQVLST